MFEEVAVLLQQFSQVFAAIGLIAGKKDLVMSPLDRCDAVDLNETEVADEFQEPVLAERALRRGHEALFCEEDAPGIAIGEANRHGPKE